MLIPDACSLPCAAAERAPGAGAGARGRAGVHRRRWSRAPRPGSWSQDHPPCRSARTQGVSESILHAPRPAQGPQPRFSSPAHLIYPAPLPHRPPEPRGARLQQTRDPGHGTSVVEPWAKQDPSETSTSGFPPPLPFRASLLSPRAGGLWNSPRGLRHFCPWSQGMCY